jgi:hypothetical protein
VIHKLLVLGYLMENHIKALKNKKGCAIWNLLAEHFFWKKKDIGGPIFHVQRIYFHKENTRHLSQHTSINGISELFHKIFILHYCTITIKEWVSNCRLTITQRFMSVSEWLLSNANSAIDQLNQDGNKLIFNEMMMTRCALYNTNTFSWILILLAHWNNSPRIDISPRPTLTHYPDSEPASLGSFYLMLRA